MDTIQVAILERSECRPNLCPSPIWIPEAKAAGRRLIGDEYPCAHRDFPVQWRCITPYAQDQDWVFPSFKM
jgi:hypothetical protein